MKFGKIFKKEKEKVDLTDLFETVREKEEKAKESQKQIDEAIKKIKKRADKYLPFYYEISLIPTGIIFKFNESERSVKLQWKDIQGLIMEFGASDLEIEIARQSCKTTKITLNGIGG